MAQKHGTIRHCVGGMRGYSACALQAQITDKLQRQSGLRGRSLPQVTPVTPLSDHSSHPDHEIMIPRSRGIQTDERETKGPILTGG